jgi:ABC-type molybdate transport system substrate-binding protein
MKKKTALILVLIVYVFVLPLQAPAQDKISVAVETSFMAAFKVMAADFEEKTGGKIEAVFSSSGNLYGQIKNGASYDAFLSGDERWPDLLQKEGWTEGTFIYARRKTDLPGAPEVVHAACVAKNTANKVCTELFMIYMMSDSAAGIKNKYGYR